MRASTAAGSNVLSIMTETGGWRFSAACAGYKANRLPQVNRRVAAPVEPFRTGGHAAAEERSSAATARDALDFGTDQTLHERRQVLVEPGLEHRSEHLGHGIFEGPRVAGGHRRGEPAKGAGR